MKDFKHPKQTRQQIHTNKLNIHYFHNSDNVGGGSNNVRPSPFSRLGPAA